ncbi:unnamed protein product [Phaedon cochleariae]|uniref:DNA repair protein REV1 n=1 Tax=Phaedon cochleariae TaxID=80249 RepID=A0A9P0GMZ6_PHACE|nr:unnamed protein product [Phaedon cochleariae]
MQTNKNDKKPTEMVKSGEGMKIGRKRKDKTTEDEDMGFGHWGGYMEAKKAKLLDQFHDSEIKKVSSLFEGIAIHVNGLTKPPLHELKNLMAAHGGIFHAYQVSSTTHIIASNLPNVKIKHLGSVPVVKPSWITDSIDLKKLLDYRRYLLYSNQSKSQPRIDFPAVEKPSTSGFSVDEKSSTSVESGPNIFEKAEVKPEVNSVGTTKVVAQQNPKFPTKTASDPSFLEEFYNNSRLHLISTLGAEFKQLVGEMRDRSDGKFPGRERLTHKDHQGTVYIHTVIMHIDMDCFFVSVGLKNHPDLRGKPVAITHARNGQLANVSSDQKADREREFALYGERLPAGAMSRVDKIDAQSSMSEIASCSYEARKFGIKNGMFLGQAVKLCPELKTLPYDFEGYKEVSNMLYKTIASYTLDIEAVSCDEMYVDITKILKESGYTVEQWANHIRNEISKVTGCPCSTGFGANRLQARLATRKAKPAGQYYLQADDVEAYMADIPLSDLPGVGRATLAKLKNLGLNTCGDVQVASLKVLQSELGQKAGETLKEQSNGIDNRPLNFHHERKSVSAEVNYGIRFQTIEECYNFLQSLSNEVYNRLSDINMRARCLTLKLLVRAADAPVETAKFLGHGVCDSLSKSTKTNLVINSSQIIFKEAKSLYEKLNPPFADLRGVGIQLSKLEKNAPTNTALSNFLKQAPERSVENTEKPVMIEKVDFKEKTDDKSSEKKISLNKKVVQTKQSSKRGRPKGSKNGTIKTTKNSTPTASLNRYFAKSKNIEVNQKSQQYIPVNSQIDMDVLKELPEELREEIIKEYQLNVKKVEAQDTTSKPASRIENKVSQSEKQVYQVEKILPPKPTNTVPMSRKSPFANLTWEQVKPIIKKWTQSGDEPSNIDIEMIADHFKHLAIDRKIEILQSAFNFLHRIFSVLTCNWHAAYFKIVDIMQQGMVARYGGTLAVKRKFECCEM